MSTFKGNTTAARCHWLEFWANDGFHWIPRCKQQIFCCCCNFLINLTSDVKFKFSPVQYTSNKPKNLYLFGNIPLPFLSIMFIISLCRMLTADKGLIGCYKVENFFNFFILWENLPGLILSTCEDSSVAILLLTILNRSLSVNSFSLKKEQKWKIHNRKFW